MRGREIFVVWKAWGAQLSQGSKEGSQRLGSITSTR